MSSELTLEKRTKSLLKKAFNLIDRYNLSSRLPVALTVLAIALGLATYYVMTTQAQAVSAFYWLLNLDLLLLLTLGALIARQILKLWRQRKEGIAGAQLHSRFVFVFSILTATPAVMMAVFSSVFFYFGVQSWFSDRVSTAVNESLNVAQAYLKEHQQVMRADVLAMASDLNKEAPYLMGDTQNFNRVVQTQSLLRNLSEAMVFTSSGRVLARSRLTFTLEFEPLPERLFDEARMGEVVLLIGGDEDDRIRALVKLDRFVDAYLFVGRLVDGNVLSHIQATESAVKEYRELEGRRSSLQVSITMMFVAVALLLLLAAVWFGLVFAEHMVEPISHLIGAAEKVRSGDFSVRVKEGDKIDELGTLVRAFNRMTRQIQEQRDEVLQANVKLDDRRRFMEAVFEGTSSGIIGLDHSGYITLVNMRASELLGYESEKLMGYMLVDFVGGLDEPINLAFEKPEKPHELQIDFKSQKTGSKTLRVCITVEKSKKDSSYDCGAVVTFDDISALVSAQRKAAWSDVARRIAHEIKNPLTPIQLSAERLKRRYLHQVQDEPDVFARCTDTIVRQVEQIGLMIGEFASYARMPEPVMRSENIDEICQEAILLQKQAHSEKIDINYQSLDSKKRGLVIECDLGQLMQVITNVVQNAVDAIEERKKQDETFLENGRIDLSLLRENHDVIISVIDNGIGLPEENREKLTEPYVTTRKKKGTGLGLAIVKRIVEDHKGSISLENCEVSDDKESFGAKITITLPVRLS